MNSPPPIEVRGLRKIFRQTTTGQSVVAIDRLDLDISPREVVAIVGQTGCGKSTFFDLMIGLAAPTEGSIHIGDKSPHSDSIIFAERLRPFSSKTASCRGVRHSTMLGFRSNLSACRSPNSANVRSPGSND
jgi:ABC-type oligopeptide transport system ATPase subunit